MSTSGWSALWTIASIELRQRVRGVGWYVLLGVFVLLILIVTVVSSVAVGQFSDDAGSVVYAAVIYFVLLLATLVTPALSGNAINGDRDAGTLATTQVTLATTSQIVLGKLLAAWISALAFVVAAVPFIVYAVAIGGLSPAVLVVSIAVLIIEMGVIAAFGVGLSGLLRRPLFSIVVTYLLIALLSVGTLIAFVLGGAAVQRKDSYEVTLADWSKVERDERAGINVYDPATGALLPEYCSDRVETVEASIPRFDLFWWTLAANPYVVLADAVPTTYDRYGNPVDLFGFIKLGVRQAQHEIPPPQSWSDCDRPAYLDAGYPTAQETIERSAPSWFIGLLVHVAAAVALIWGAIARTRTPARRLPPGSRVA